MFHRRKRRRLFTEVIREKTTSLFYPFIQEATSNLLLNLLRTPEDFLVHITMCVLVFISSFFSLLLRHTGMEQAVYFQVHMGAKLLNQRDSRYMHGSSFLKY
jgi:hypothetical protein